tara:strand:- start:56 stop:1567 length:1512 start_codon:yes stop_codon:yes gene_type:complete
MKDDKIFIVGGGSAGWMTAATLIKAFPKKDITVIESPDIKTIGVGESTLGQINEWLDFLDIKDEDFMSFTKASYKLSIRFEDFYKKGDGGFHYPFGSVFENNFVGDKEFWFSKKKFFPETLLSDYATSISTNMALVNNNVLFKNEDQELPLFNFKKDVAYHFDASKFGEWLKEYYCKPKGVKHIVEEIINIKTNEKGIKNLNNKYDADLFIDCTGFKSLLLGKTLKEPFCDYSHLLPNNKAWATSVPYKNKEKELKPYTNCTAIENGWVWNIPSWDKIGTGYVYSDKYISDKKALAELKKHLNKKGLNYTKSTFNNIKMRVGIHERLFVKNVCAIGLSAGFIEPLESNGLLSVHEFLLNLINILKRGKITQWNRDNFNVSCKKYFDVFTEFVASHYALSQRTDTPYWQDISNKSFYDNRLVDSELKLTLDCYMDRFNFFKSNAGMHYISTGMNYLGKEPVDKEMSTEFKHILQLRKNELKKWNDICKNKKSLLNFLKDTIYKS